MVYERLRNLREDKDLTQQQIAELLFINTRTYSSYEAGSRMIPTKLLIQIANIHGVSVDYLLGLTDVQTPYPEKRK